MALTPEEIIQIAQPYKVPYLYKYRSFQDRGIKRIFTHQEIYLASPVQFNDPFDCKPILKASDDLSVRSKFLSSIVKSRFPNATPQEHLYRIKEGLNRTDLFERDILEDTYMKSIKPYGIYSLSEINNDILMWSHYGHAHSGICLEFDSNIEGTIFWEAIKVHYQKKIPVVDPLLFEEDDNFLKALAVKSNHWSYEKKRRVIKTKEEGGYGIHIFGPNLLKGVILGLNIRSKDEELINEWVDLYPTPINIYRAVINREKYSLYIVSNESNESASPQRRSLARHLTPYK